MLKHNLRDFSPETLAPGGRPVAVSHGENYYTGPNPAYKSTENFFSPFGRGPMPELPIHGQFGSAYDRQSRDER